jgi:hypothetical protein
MIVTPDNKLIYDESHYPVAVAVDDARAVEISRAINAYPKLVAALRAIKAAASNTANSDRMTRLAIMDMTTVALTDEP